MINKGDIIEIEIIDMNEKAQGIGKADSLVIFVENTIFGQTVKARIDKLKSNFALATAIEVVKETEHRSAAVCPHLDCGGCAYKELAYDAQLRLKQDQVMQKLARLADVRLSEPFEIIGMSEPFHYRNKAQLQIGCNAKVRSKNAKSKSAFCAAEPQIGFYKLSSHEVLDCSECALQKKVVWVIAKALTQFIKFEHLSVFDEISGKGLFKNLIVKIAESTGEIMVILVLNGKAVPNAEKLVNLLDSAINEYACENGDTYSLESVMLNINEGKTSCNMGPVNKLLAGKLTIVEKLGDLDFEISAGAFYQVNPTQTLKLYKKVLEFANLAPTDNVLDLYCGVGTIGLFCAGAIADACKTAPASKCGRVIGVESVKSAVIDANRNATINCITNAEFICGKAELVLERILNGYTDDYGFEVPPFSPDVLILDPPRSGCKPELLEALRQTSARKLIYVSCEPATLARDLKILLSQGYTLQNGCIIDMFPHTSKVEVAIKLENKSI